MTVVRHPSARQCTHVDPTTGERCITLLCHANVGPECFAHDPQWLAKLRRQRERREAIAFEEIMKQLGQGERIAA